MKCLEVYYRHIKNLPMRYLNFQVENKDRYSRSVKYKGLDNHLNLSLPCANLNLTRTCRTIYSFLAQVAQLVVAQLVVAQLITAQGEDPVFFQPLQKNNLYSNGESP
jgi:hypothetical protein